MQPINSGSLAWTSSNLMLTVFTEHDCKGKFLGKSPGNFLGINLVYSQTAAFGGQGRIRDAEKFKSIRISRSLQDQEQLDLSRSIPDDQHACGEYIMNFRVGTKAGCRNIPNGVTAECVRLWHY